jgi:hypothetical protein
MSPTRRSFLRTLLALPIAATLDVEKLLWMPGQQIAVPSTYVPISLDEINAVTMREIMPGIADQFFKTSPVLQYLQAKSFQQHWDQPWPTWERAQ